MIDFAILPVEKIANIRTMEYPKIPIKAPNNSSDVFDIKKALLNKIGKKDNTRNIKVPCIETAVKFFKKFFPICDISALGKVAIGIGAIAK